MLPRIICTTVLVETSPQAMPLGAACIASAIKACDLTKGKFTVELSDFSREDPQYIKALKASGEEGCVDYIAQSLAEVYEDNTAVAVCFSVYVWNHKILEKVALKLKKILPSVICIAGGPEVTANPAVFKGFDYTVAGQGELAVPELLYKLFVSKDSTVIPGVYHGTDTGSVRGCPLIDGVVRANPCAPETTPSPYLDGTLDPAKYGGALWELARGCPFKCSYCYESKGEKKIAYFPMDRLEKEIELFAAKKIPQVFVLDPTYNADKNRAIQMLNILRKKAPGMFFYFEARAEFIDRNLAKAFAKIPCCIQFGMQSSNPDVLKNVHRTIDRKLYEKNIAYLNEEGVIFGFDLIFGLPGDTIKGFYNSIDFALSLYPNNLELFCLSVLPGTRLYDDAAGFGLVWDKEPPYHVESTPQFSAADIKKAALMAKATNVFYSLGRAVPWFNSVLYPLKTKASVFLDGFIPYITDKEEYSDDEIERCQIEYVTKKYREKHLDKILPVAIDVIRMNNAISRITSSGCESHITLSYHPDDIMSEYAGDIEFFAENCGKQKCNVYVFETPQGPDWRLERRSK